MGDDNLDRELKAKAARKAAPGGGIKWINLPRNWAHQAMSYMDAGELSLRIVVEAVQIAVTYLLLGLLFEGWNPLLGVAVAFLVVHTWNWVTNGLFWAVAIFTFPWLRNPGAQPTCDYLNRMASRLDGNPSVLGLAVYGSIARGKWHARSDIDIRILRSPGLMNLLRAGIATMQERFIAVIAKQPMDLYMADDTDFLLKLRADERPLILLEKNDCLKEMYPSAARRELTLADLQSNHDRPAPRA